METQRDYETEPILAVFRTTDEALDALQRLRAAGIPEANVARVALPPGRYQAEDHTLHDEGDGVRHGAAIGAPIGAAVGLGLAAVLPSGMGPVVVAGLAGMGAVDGAILGGFVGAIARAHFDDDVAGTIEVPADGSMVLVAVHAGGASNESARARDALKRAGAVAFLDATLSDTDSTLRAATLDDSTASPGTAAHPQAPPPATA
jgi:hypothetical protein